MRSKTLFGFLFLAMATVALVTSTSPAQAQDATELMKEAHLNMYYPGDDGSARVAMIITDKRGRTRERDFVILRRDWEDGGEQRYYVYFFQPNDVRRTTFMAWKDPDGNDSRWIYLPSLDLVKPISANDKESSFVGSDFAYEDVSGRHWNEDTHTLLGEETYQDWETWKIESVPKEDDYFAKKISWIDKESMLVVREEYYDSRGEPLKIFEVGEIEVVDGYATATVRTMTTPRKDNSTVIEFSEIDYDTGVDEDIFSERYLKSPPRKYIQ